MKCKWNVAWVGPCQKEAEGKTEYCKEHTKKCCSCGKPATHDCDETGMFVCGAPLCGDCKHTTFPDGTNGGVGFNEEELPEGMKRHSKKAEQKYKLWYEREDLSGSHPHLPKGLVKGI